MSGKFCSFHLISNALIGTLLCPGNRQTKTTSLHWDPWFLRIVLWRRHKEHFSHKYMDGLNVNVIVWQRQMQLNRWRPYKLQYRIKKILISWFPEMPFQRLFLKSLFFWESSVNMRSHSQGINKHRKNCKSCPVSLSTVRSQWLPWYHVLNCQSLICPPCILSIGLGSECFCL